MTGLFIEETVGNAMNHKSGKEVLAEIRVIHREDAHIIRIRDNGKQFDPVKWYEQNHPEDPSSGLGIRMIMKLAKDVDFIPALGLNNLMITL
jgi:serine/threonine-protein kinase RsbW